MSGFHFFIFPLYVEENLNSFASLMQLVGGFQYLGNNICGCLWAAATAYRDPSAHCYLLHKKSEIHCRFFWQPCVTINLFTSAGNAAVARHIKSLAVYRSREIVSVFKLKLQSAECDEAETWLLEHLVAQHCSLLRGKIGFIL